MTADQFGGIVRHILTFGAGFIVAKGYVDASTATEIVASATALCITVWSMYTNRKSKIIPSDKLK